MRQAFITKSYRYLILVALAFAVGLFLFPIYNARADDVLHLQQIQSEILAYFKPIEGTVIGVGNDLAKLDVGKNDQVRVGMRFSVFEQGEAFHHPVTGEFINYIERQKGIIQIEKVDDDSSIGRIVKGDLPALQDRARVSSGYIRLAFFQDCNVDWALSETLYNALKDSNRFELVETYTPKIEPLQLAKSAKQLGAQNFLLLSTENKENSIVLDIKIFWTDDASQLIGIKHALPLQVYQKNVVKQKPIPVSLMTIEPWATYDLSGGRLLAFGDVDGNKKKDLVTSDGKREITFYTYEDKPIEKSTFELNRKGEHLSLDLYDSNRDGKDEIFVTILSSNHAANSVVLQYDDASGFTEIAGDIPYFIRVVDNTLLVQSYNKKEGLTGPVYQATFQNGEILPKTPLQIPSAVGVYGFTYLKEPEDTGQARQLMAIDGDGYITLYLENDILWRSKDSYAGSTFKSSLKKGVLRYKKKKLARGRLLAAPTSRGVEALIVKNRPILGKWGGMIYRAAEIYSFYWNGAEMVQQKILNVNGRVTDYWFDNDGLYLLATPTIYGDVKKLVSGNLPKRAQIHYFRPSTIR